MSKAKKVDKRRVEWEINHIIIRKAFIELIKEKKRAPTYKELAEKAGFARRIVIDHVKNFEFDEIKQKMALLSEDVLLGIYRAAVQGNTGAQRLWVQLINGWSETKNINVSEKKTFAEWVSELDEETQGE